LNDKLIYKYLGYKGNIPDENVLNIIKLCKQEVLENENSGYVYKVFDIEIKEDSVEVLGTNLSLTGKSITNHLKGCNAVILLCATLGVQVDKYIKLCELKDMSKALIADSVASVRIDDFCDDIETELKEKYKDMYFTYRFGLGYGDLPLKLEPIFLNILDAGKVIGVTTNESFLLTPRKSVACVIGLSKNPLDKKSRGCVTCNMKDVCQYRADGGHCGF